MNERRENMPIEWRQNDNDVESKRKTLRERKKEMKCPIDLMA